MLNIKPIILKGSWVQLELLSESHKTELYDAAQDEIIWMYSSSKALGAKFYDWFDKALLASKQQQQLPFVVKRLIDKKIIGSTRYYDIDPKHHRLSIGYTWYIPTVWGSYVNPECKLLLLTFAFEELQVNRVQFTTDSRNFHSRLAIKKLGATEEGTLRQHMIVENGGIRDSVVFSIIKADWPQVKLSLQERLAKFS